MADGDKPLAIKPDSFTPFDRTLAEASLSDPWAHGPGQKPIYAPDYSLLRIFSIDPGRCQCGVSERGSRQRGRFLAGP